MPKLILDVMGGDRAPQAILEGAIQALPHLEGELVLVGDEAQIRPMVQKRRYRALASAFDGGTAGACRLSFIQSSQTIEMEDSIRAIRSKPGATINIGCKMAAEDWKAYRKDGVGSPSAFISAGHSGAMMASALLNMGRLRGVERPGIAITLPTLSPHGCIVLDAGANVDCKPEHLRDFAIMGALYAQAIRKSDALPRVGLLSNGEERSKGNTLTQESLELVEKLPCFGGSTAEGGSAQPFGKFVGYVEGKEIFKGQVDVVVTDGFVGNVVLKSLEGLGSTISHFLKQEASRNPLNKLGFILAAGAFRNLKRKLDYAEYGAAPLLGVAGYAFICHGRSNAKAIKNALLVTQRALHDRFLERLDSEIAS